MKEASFSLTYYIFIEVKDQCSIRKIYCVDPVYNLQGSISETGKINGKSGCDRTSKDKIQKSIIEIFNWKDHRGEKSIVIRKVS